MNRKFIAGVILLTLAGVILIIKSGQVEGGISGNRVTAANVATLPLPPVDQENANALDPLAAAGTSLSAGEPQVVAQRTVEQTTMLERGTLFLRKTTYRRFLAKTKLGLDQQQELMLLCAESAPLAQVRRERLERGEFGSVGEADAFYRSEIARLDALKRALLGDEYADYWTATEKAAFEQQMRFFSIVLKNRGVPIDQNQSDQLVDLYWKYYKPAGVDLFFSVDYSRIASAEKFYDQMEKRTLADEEVRKAASTFLSAAQLEKLALWQKQQIEGMVMRAKIPPSRNP